MIILQQILRKIENSEKTEIEKRLENLENIYNIDNIDRLREENDTLKNDISIKEKTIRKQEETIKKLSKK